jgi:hypothetical protein
MIKGAESIKQIETQDLTSIELNKIVKVGISEDAYILVQKMTGTSMKEFLKERELLRGLYANHSIMIIHRTMMPLFYNMNNNKIYYCKRMRAYPNEESGQKYFYPGKWVEYGGHFECFIHDTRYTWKDESMDHHVYYIIVSKGSNKYDGTNQFVETQKLSGNELKIRQTQRDIVVILVKPKPDTNRSLEEESIAKQEISQMSFYLNVIISIMILLFYIFKN